MSSIPPAAPQSAVRLRRLAIPVTLALGVTATPFLHNAPDHPAVPSRHTRAVFISQHGGALFHHTGTLDEVLHGVATSGYNEVYFGVYGLGGPFFPSRHGPSHPAYVPPWTDPLREAIRQAHRQGLRTGAWFEYGLMLQPGSAIARRHPEWLLRLPGGRSVVEGREWLNPSHPGVQRFLLGLMSELAAYPDLANIQLDDHWGVPAAFGNHRAAVTALTRATHRAVKRIDPRKVVSLSPNNYRFARDRYNQDWLPWVREGLIEEVVLQAYRKNEQQVLAEVDGSGLHQAARRVPCAVALHAGADVKPFLPGAVARQVRAVEQRGYGHAIFVWEYMLLRWLNDALGGPWSGTVRP